jgi:hypothetical protein
VGVPVSKNDNLAKRCGVSFVRQIAQGIVPELISRIGNKWHGAHNKSIAANLLRYCVIADDVDGLAETYDVLAGNNPRAEQSVVARILRSGQHAARQHRTKVAELVRQLFEPTLDDAEMHFVKETVFGVTNGAPIMAADHPAIKELFSIYQGACTNYYKAREAREQLFTDRFVCLRRSCRGQAAVV